MEIWEGSEGEVVASIDLSQYSDEYTEDDWAYLNSGVLIRSDKGNLFHLIEPDFFVKILARSRT
ncbi:MAG: hypothetical protein WD397_06305 [Wenzhouxiangellaceae bacterium]